MALIDKPRALCIRAGHEPVYLDPDTGVLGGTYESNSTHELICALADICNGIGAQVRFGYQEQHGRHAVHYVSVFCKEHPDWIAAFINRLIIHRDLHVRTINIMLSNFEVKTVHYDATDHGLTWEENPVTKIGYRLVFRSLRTIGFLDHDGEELIDLNDYVDTGEVSCEL